MIVHMSIHTPRPGKERDLIASMHRYGAAAEGQPGFIEARALRDRETGRLIGMAVAGANQHPVVMGLHPAGSLVEKARMALMNLK
jgi:hypothetical protein